MPGRVLRISWWQIISPGTGKLSVPPLWAARAGTAFYGGSRTSVQCFILGSAVRSSRPFLNNPQLTLKLKYASTEREPFLKQDDAGNSLSSLGVIQAWGKTAVVKQRAVGTCFSLGREQTCVCCSPGPVFLLSVPVSEPSWLQPDLAHSVHPTGCSCVLPVTLPAGKCSLLITVWCVCFSGVQRCCADAVAVDQAALSVRGTAREGERCLFPGTWGGAAPISLLSIHRILLHEIQMLLFPLREREGGVCGAHGGWFLMTRLLLLSCSLGCLIGAKGINFHLILAIHVGS